MLKCNGKSTSFIELPYAKDQLLGETKGLLGRN